MSVPDNRVKRLPVLLTVKSVQDLGPRYRRITFTSPELAHYPPCSNGAHIKIMLSQDGQSEPVLPTMTATGPKWESPEDKPLLRTFSVRELRRETGEMDIDFALHGDLGPASRFALNARPGDQLGISPPGGPYPMLKPASHYYLAGDLTALPAISAMLEDMPADSRGYVAIQVSDETDIQDLRSPAGVEVQWFIGQPDQVQPLIDQFCQQPFSTEMTADSYFWLGGEEQIVVGLRRFIRRELDVERTQVYAIPYWRFGIDEDSYHTSRHQVVDN
ncbi:siderophore-interacting protein [Photobacterium halotolerans]|uniref:siderophore-interacting protein n=1 Tax=Photobacterium halotolerans TaxID=265726 RepID=UPI0013731548|nr:siderophore-interacting protein [Photobacterium halotolerans]NAW87038.1 SIP domain-containing protein [Photobacterium halotolerans]